MFELDDTIIPSAGIFPDEYIRYFPSGKWQAAW